jgi:cell division protein FtsB
VSTRTHVLDRDRPRLTARAAILLVTVLVLAIMGTVPLRGFVAQRARIADLERQTAALEQANSKLRSQIQALHDPSELERLARECLGMVEPGEVALVVPSRPGDTEPSDC